MMRLSYLYSELDKQHEFFLEIKNSDGMRITNEYTQWIYFGIGETIEKTKIQYVLYPYGVVNLSNKKVKILREWKINFHRSAILYGRTIGKLINKQLSRA